MLLKQFKMHPFANAKGWITSKKDFSSLCHLPSCTVLCSSGTFQCVSAETQVPAEVCRSHCCFRILFHSLTFSVKHLGDVQELLSHLKGSVQVTNRVILQGDNYCKTRPGFILKHTFTFWYQVDNNHNNSIMSQAERKQTEKGFIHCFK